MERRDFRFPRPVYEGLPWFYVGCGLLALVASYQNESRFFSLILGVLGIFCVLGGIVVLLRRRDFRALRAQYHDVDSADPGGGKE